MMRVVRVMRVMRVMRVVMKGCCLIYSQTMSLLATSGVNSNRAWRLGGALATWKVGARMIGACRSNFGGRQRMAGSL